MAIIRQETPHAFLRLVREEDAAFVVQARQGGERTRFLHTVGDDVETQRAFIRGSLERTAQATEYYFVIEAKTDAEPRPVGLLRLTEVTAESFVIGSWVTVADCPVFAGIESFFAACDFGFGALGCAKYIAEIKSGNARRMAFHGRMKSRELGRFGECERFEQPLAGYLEARRRYRKYVCSDELPPRLAPWA